MLEEKVNDLGKRCLIVTEDKHYAGNGQWVEGFNSEVQFSYHEAHGVMERYPDLKITLVDRKTSIEFRLLNGSWYVWNPRKVWHKFKLSVSGFGFTMQHKGTHIFHVDGVLPIQDTAEFVFVDGQLTYVSDPNDYGKQIDRFEIYSDASFLQLLAFD